MKNRLVLALVTLSAVVFTLQAETGHEGHDHESQSNMIEKGKAPHGGRLIIVGDLQLEFYVTPERVAEVRFLDHDMQEMTKEVAHIQVVTQAASGSQKFDLVPKAAVFVSEKALPEGDPYNIVLRVKRTVDSGFENVRFVYNVFVCGGCNLAEYACTCEGHDH